ncbi:MAG: radical SAM family heme chaperone HemW [Candidatus Marinimicrobia bacterium]|jgi:oxygen-independent coproporphyrinogen-3 oxidase|nr:radical SAM family heme chaperone HemW [Candidatus Neomarinimicrobiota bacterium]MBT4736109.1 radical SAM family heme chaperone HemW [Candidatus Neomarinimicrobiota bacterium]MBT6389756.1 radical SAM family heme chaperone HemW [Candidatus Neomarinimicrobiota bacterium]
MYCDFYSVADRDDAIPAFFEALLKEIDMCETDTSDRIIDTIFIGGGTPSLTPPHQLEKLIRTLDRKFNISQVTEFTMEANPGEAPADNLKAFHELGVNRISMGVQSLEPDLLKFLTRIHGPEAVFNTFDAARQAGFDNINCDLIFNIPGQTIDIWQRDLQRIIDLEPEHMSCYSLTVEEGTQLYQYVNRGKVTMPSNDQSAEFYQWTRSTMTDNGFEQYEISNWSKPNLECKHNLHYWEIEPYLAFGPSAHGFDGKNRFSNIRNLDGYIKNLGDGKLPRQDDYELSDKDRTNEMIGFGLRIKNGVNLNKIPESFRGAVNQSINQNQSKWGNYFIKEKDRLKLTDEGFAFADGIAVDVMID